MLSSYTCASTECWWESIHALSFLIECHQEIDFVIMALFMFGLTVFLFSINVKSGFIEGLQNREISPTMFTYSKFVFLGRVVTNLKVLYFI
jgi:hypothetical protein